MNEINPSEEVANYCIDNQLTFTEGYVVMIEEKLAKIEENLRDLRRDVELTIENISI